MVGRLQGGEVVDSDVDSVERAELEADHVAWARERDERGWETLQEDEDGRLLGQAGFVEEQRAKRRRREREQRSFLGGSDLAVRIRRGMIRYFVLAIDFSRHAASNDLRPSRLSVVSSVARAFVRAFFEENPLSHLGVTILRDGVSTRVTELSGAPETHVAAITREAARVSGELSLQNTLDSIRPELATAPPYGCKEALIIASSLVSRDPGDVFGSIAACKKEGVRVNVIGVAAEVHIHRRVAQETGGRYAVATGEEHLKELVMVHASPPPQKDEGTDTGVSLVRMGFPEQAPPASVAFQPARQAMDKGGFVCPQCRCRVKELPVECPTCSLMLISAPHLARSYHHLFPVPVFQEVDGDRPNGGGDVVVGNVKGKSGGCFSCEKDIKGVSLRCPKCRNIFCFDCDAYVHERLFVCPGCPPPVY